ncbi:hypothetical protein LTR37_017064 [Vermiconidia calcicola]|uniref:Uncharacterized protein n=1 Tax=Vermiconidia calcicola TaxID=1690605 RepID=A0ACC3ML33_9PEZI|nr:hypothetical protein LTR37_017064 [Vermiconidia calcicola]
MCGMTTKSKARDALIEQDRIYGRACEVTHGFQSLLHDADQRFEEEQGSATTRYDAVENAFDKYLLWAGNMGALHADDDTRSLGYRLRNATPVRKRICDILDELLQLQGSSSLRSEEPVATEQRFQLANVDVKLAQEILGLTTSAECQESWIFASLSDAVSRLFRVSKLIGRSTTSDRHAKAETAGDAKFDESYDTAHVKHKFVDAKAESWLLDRLGKANTKRRQYFRYCQNHREWIAGGIHSKLTMAPNVQLGSNVHHRGSSYRTQPTPTLGSKPSVMKSAASTLGPVDLSAVDVGFDDTATVTTAVTNTYGDQDSRPLPVPKLVDIAESGTDFECPYCHTIQKFNGQRGWKAHVFTDLRPYICTAKQCGLMMFDDRRAWEDHEMENHHRCWICQICGIDRFNCRDELISHVQQRHDASLQGKRLDLLISTCSRPKEIFAKGACLLCDWSQARLANKQMEVYDEFELVTRQHFLRHLGTHLEQIGLFSLPRNDYVELGTDKAGAGPEATEVSTRSSLTNAATNEWQNATPAGSKDPGDYSHANALNVERMQKHDGNPHHSVREAGVRASIWLEQDVEADTTTTSYTKGGEPIHLRTISRDEHIRHEQHLGAQRDREEQEIRWSPRQREAAEAWLLGSERFQSAAEGRRREEEQRYFAQHRQQQQEQERQQILRPAPQTLQPPFNGPLFPQDRNLDIQGQSRIETEFAMRQEQERQERQRIEISETNAATAPTCLSTLRPEAAPFIPKGKRPTLAVNTSHTPQPYSTDLVPESSYSLVKALERGKRPPSSITTLETTYRDNGRMGALTARRGLSIRKMCAGT